MCERSSNLIPWNSFINGDCMEYMKELPDVMLWQENGMQ